MNRFQLVAVGVRHECGIVGGAVVRPFARRAFIAPAQTQRRGMERIDRGTARRRECQVKPGAGRRNRVRLDEQRQPVVPPASP